MTCERCNGAGTILEFDAYRDPHRPLAHIRVEPCPTCRHDERSHLGGECHDEPTCLYHKPPPSASEVLRRMGKH